MQHFESVFRICRSALSVFIFILHRVPTFLETGLFNTSQTRHLTYKNKKQKQKKNIEAQKICKFIIPQTHSGNETVTSRAGTASVRIYRPRNVQQNTSV